MKNIIIKQFVIVFLICLSSINLKSQELETKVVAGNLKTVWELLWGPDNHLWITERSGIVSRINPVTGKKFTLLTISEVFEDGERGLMGIALHPNFSENPYVYIVYNYLDGLEYIKIIRYTYNGQILSDPFTIIDKIKGNWNHNGSRLLIDDDLKLWFTIGDIANSDLAQNLTNVYGKLSRANLDGTIPADNPFPNSYIWSFGHRNQQGLVKVGNKIYTSEHGASTNDEINLILKGRNYGWPNVQGFCNTAQELDFCEKNNLVEPLMAINPTSTMAICGIDYYNHDLIPDWKNSLIITSLKSETLIICLLDETGEKVLDRKEYFMNEFGRLRDVCISPDGRVFMATSNRDGRASGKFRDSMDKIIEIKPKITGINDEFEESNEIFVSPNPVNDKITINGLSAEKSFIRLEIVDILGNIISLQNTNHNREIDVSNLGTGFYFMRIFSDADVKIAQFFKR